MEAVTASPPAPELDSPELYSNRELSWLQFNERVLELAEDESLPLLERVKFLAIYASNLDEFYMVRVAGLHDQVDAGIAAADGLSPGETLVRIAERTRELGDRHSREWENDRARARREGIRVVDCSDLRGTELEAIDRQFSEQIFPVLTPLAVGPGRPFPYISNLSLSLAVWLRDPVSRHRDVRPREGAQGGAAALRADRRERVRAARERSRATSTSSSPAWRSCATTTSGYARRRLHGLRRGRRPPARGRGRAAPAALRRGRPARDRPRWIRTCALPRRAARDRRDAGDRRRRAARPRRPLGALRRGGPPRAARPALDARHQPAFADPDDGRADVLAAMRAGDILVHHPYDSFAGASSASSSRRWPTRTCSRSR